MPPDSLQRRLAAGLFGVPHNWGNDQRPPIMEGYSIPRRVLAGLLGVRLPEIDQTKAATSPPPVASIVNFPRDSRPGDVNQADDVQRPANQYRHLAMVAAVAIVAIGVTFALQLSEDRSQVIHQTSPITSVAQSPNQSNADSTSLPTTTIVNPLTDPPQVVMAYFLAVSRRDYATAWALGGRNLDADYKDFIANNQGIYYVTVDDAVGDSVLVSITTIKADGTDMEFRGTYTVKNGVIVNADIQRLN